jgi:hypothetical protein
MPLSGEENHLRTLFDTLLSTSNARKGEENHALLGSTDASAPSRVSFASRLGRTKKTHNAWQKA